jgi:uncharacterized protein (TIGR03083 family)
MPHFAAMDFKELTLGRIAADGPAMLDAARRDPAAPVAACPGWTVDKLVGHMGRIHTWVAQLVRSRTRERISSRLFPEGPEDNPELRLAWARERHAELLDALGDLDEDEPIWTIAPAGMGTGRFWMRRQAHELALHRWDAQDAVGHSEPLHPELSADGIDELLSVFLPGLTESTQQVSSDGATMHVHCTDVEGEWLVRFTPDGAVTTAEHAKGDLAVRGSASDLYLLLWNRTRISSAVEAFGDTSLLDRWAEHVRI